MSEGICYGCRHAGDTRYSTSGHCHGAGDLAGNQWWPGFTCTCSCRDVDPMVGDGAMLEVAMEERAE